MSKLLAARLYEILASASRAVNSLGDGTRFVAVTAIGLEIFSVDGERLAIAFAGPRCEAR